MQFNKIYSVHPRPTHKSTLRSLIVLGLEQEEIVVGVSHGRTSPLLNRLDAMPQNPGEFRSTQLNSNQFPFRNY